MLQALNTKAVGYGGVASFAIGLLCFGPFQDALAKALPAGAGNYLALAFVIAGFAASYYGMPHSVNPQVTK